jgi:putative transposase
MVAARPFYEKAMRENRTPEKIAMDKSGTNKAAIDEINGGMAVPITVRQVVTPHKKSAFRSRIFYLRH